MLVVVVLMSIVLMMMLVVNFTLKVTNYSSTIRLAASSPTPDCTERSGDSNCWQSHMASLQTILTENTAYWISLPLQHNTNSWIGFENSRAVSVAV